MFEFIKKIFSFFLVLTVMNFGSLTGADKDDDISVIAENISSGLISGDISPFSGSDKSSAEDIIALAAPDGDGGYCFTDIDYENGDRASWPAAKHIARTERLAIEYRRVLSPVKKNEYRIYIMGLLDNWINNDYRNSNWWFGRLSIPNALGETAILMREQLSGKRFAAICELVGRGSFTLDRNNRNLTGANATDVAMSTIKYGVLTGSRYAIRYAVNKVSQTLEYSDGEGLKSDASYFQHGNRLYMGGYGITFISGMSLLITILSGSSYGFTQEQLGRVSSFILDGMQVMSFGNTLDPTTLGRSVSRRFNRPLASASPIIKKLAAVPEMPRKEELLAYANSIDNDETGSFGVNYFPVAKFLVVNTPDFYFSFRGGSNDMNYSEIINSENVLAYNSSFPGVTTVMSTGDEYTDISPVMDFCAVPGTTAVRLSDEELFAVEDFTYRTLNGDYFDAVADGAAVVSAKTVHEGIKMTVSCFAADNAVLLLGADMTDASGRAMTTTLNQTVANGNDIVKDGNTVIYSGIKYTLLSGGGLNARIETRNGNWNRNNLSLADTPACAEIFTVDTPCTGFYAYTLMSENTDAEFTVIVNTGDIQAARLPDGRTAATFYKAGSFTFEGKTYSSDIPGSFIF